MMCTKVQQFSIFLLCNKKDSLGVVLPMGVFFIFLDLFNLIVVFYQVNKCIQDFILYRENKVVKFHD